MERTDHRSRHPYRATKLWNEILFAFRFGMPLKRHRKHVKVYDECFKAVEAIDWLHGFLQNNPNFGTHVTRIQTVQLLKKFYKSEVFEEVKKKKTKGESQFTDDHTLYRFAAISTTPIKSSTIRRPIAARTPLAALNFERFRNGSHQSSSHSERMRNLNPSSTVPSNQDAFLPIYTRFSLLLWKKLVLRRLMSMLCAITLDGVLDVSKISGLTIIHNVTRLDKNSVVAISDKSDDFPHWILLAMKCLVVWPNARGSGSCLPNYPGFAVDVFQVIKDYFLNLGEPLIPKHLYKLFRLILSTRDTARENESIPSECSGPISANPGSRKTSTPVTCENDYVPSGSLPRWCHRTESRQMRELSGIVMPPIKRLQQRNIKRPIRRSMSLPRLHASTEMTSHANDVSWSEIQEIHKSMPSDLESLGPPEDLTCSQYYRYEANNGFLIESNISGSYHTASSSSRFLKDNSVKNEDRGHSFDDVSDSKSEDRKSECPELADLDLQPENCDLIDDLLPGESECPIFDLMNDQRGFSANVDSGDAVFLERWKYINVKEYPYGDQLSEADKTELVKRLQICTLLLNPPERRKLHLMLQFFQKMILNKNLNLHPSWPVKILLVETFAPCILNDVGETDCDERIPTLLTGFLINHVDDVFTPPDDLKEDFRNIWRLHCEQEIMYSAKPSVRQTFCKQVSTKKYEEQKELFSRQALRQLLQDILRDPRLTEKQRQRKLNQFKENHSEVYESEFPNDAACAKRQRQKNEGKLNLITRIKNFRL